MIFVTVGEQLPFDRLVRTVDEWAAISGKEVFAQIGRSNWKPSHIAYKEFLSPEEFMGKIRSAKIIISHAGMGTIITALDMGKPILVMPRQAALGEVRNDHQFASAQRFSLLKYVWVALDEAELKVKLDNLVEIIESQKERGKAVSTSPSLINIIRNFVEAR